MPWEASGSILTVGSTLVSVCLGAYLQHLGSTAQARRQETERSRTLLREKLEELSTTIEQFRDGVKTATTFVLECALTGRLRDEETGVKKFPRLEMLVRFYAPSIEPRLVSLREVWEAYGEAWIGVIDSRKLEDSERRKAMVVLVSCSEQISSRCDAMQSQLVDLLRGTLA